MTTRQLPSLELAVEHVENFICELQKSKVILQEEIKAEQRNFDYSLNDVAFKIIELLDLIDLCRTNENLDISSNAQIVIKKIEKRLVDILLHLQVEEIELQPDLLEADKIRVIATQERLDGTTEGSIIEICRKGYQRAGRVIRPADVITACKTKS